MSALIEARGLSVGFAVGRSFLAQRRMIHAVVDVDLTIEQGEVLGLVGESGSGKSTLGRLLLGLLPPDRGSIRLAGKNLAELDRRALAQKIQPVFQDPYSSLNPRKSVAAIVALPLAVLDIGTGRERRRRAIAMLERVGLPARYADVYPNELSGGQRQRVAIARALAVEPQIVLLDEPTSALDVSVQSQILNLLIDLRRDLGLTYLFISHNLAVVRHMATRIGVMYLGRIVELAPAAELFEAPRHPYTRMLLDALPDLGMTGRPRRPIEGEIPNPIAPPLGCAFHPRCPHAFQPCRADVPCLVDRSGHSAACHAVEAGRI
jgi:peptide/nickel transport system ATP-binding protein